MAEFGTAELRKYLQYRQWQEVSVDQIRSDNNIDRMTKAWKAIPNMLFQLEEQKVVKWVRRGRYRVVKQVSPAATSQPSAMEITPKTPYSNLLNLRQILQNCEHHIWWADRYFNARGLEELIRNIDLALVREVRILSGPDNLDERAKREFARFREEMENGGVSAEWRVLKGFAHDRFIISGRACWVVPSIDTVVRGQYSQILETPNRPPFDEWWKVAIPIRDYKP